jgi:tRNA-modifying protein YgfZ
MACAALTHRGVIRISGEDKTDFLQGIVTQDIRRVSSDKLLYGCFLTPQGKYLVDFFITERDGAFLLDVDRSLIADFIKRLTMYKLRSRVVIEDVSDHYHVTAYWQERPESSLALEDPRAPNIGWRSMDTEKIEAHDNYALWQLQNGLPDVGDFLRERTTMLESNMDLLNAVSFDKGCYMGQELTARTHYRGLIKKRFFPIRFESDVSIAFETPVEKESKIIGQTRTQRNDWAMAVLQLENLQNGDVVTAGGHTAKVAFPTWFDRNTI